MPRKPRARKSSTAVVDEKQKAIDELAAREKQLADKNAALQKEAEELDVLRRAHIMRHVNAVPLSQHELDVFVAVFSALPGKQKIADQLMQQFSDENNRGVFFTKLVRMGIA